MRVRVVDPSSYTLPYDRALCSALARAGVQTTLKTFYRRTLPGRAKLPSKLAWHVPEMLVEARAPADVTHFQWLAVQYVDGHLLPRDCPVVLTAHDVLPREQRLPGQRRAQTRLYDRVDAIVVHSQHGRTRLIDEAGADPAKVHVIGHGAFTHMASWPRVLPAGLGTGPDPAHPLPAGSGTGPDPARPIVLFFGLIRPYKGLDVLLDAWRRAQPEAELWVVGRPRGVDLAALDIPAGVKVVPRFVSDAELAGVFAAADLVVLPYREIDQSGVLAAGLGFGKPLLVSDAGGLPELGDAVRVTPRGDADALAQALNELIADPAQREALAAAARAKADGELSWDAIARAHRALYEALHT